MQRDIWGSGSVGLDGIYWLLTSAILTYNCQIAQNLTENRCLRPWLTDDWQLQWMAKKDSESLRLVWTVAHQMEPPSPIQALGVNPFPSRFINRTVPRGDFPRRQWEEPVTTTIWQCCCTSSNRKFGVDRPNTIISSETWPKRFHPSEIFFLFFVAGRL